MLFEQALSRNAPFLITGTVDGYPEPLVATAKLHHSAANQTPAPGDHTFHFMGLGYDVGVNLTAISPNPDFDPDHVPWQGR